MTRKLLRNRLKKRNRNLYYLEWFAHTDRSKEGHHLLGSIMGGSKLNDFLMVKLSKLEHDNFQKIDFKTLLEKALLSNERFMREKFGVFLPPISLKQDIDDIIQQMERRFDLMERIISNR